MKTRSLKYSAIKNLICWAQFLALCLLSTSLLAINNPTLSRPAISIIIDDIGYQYERDIKSIRLPGAITFSILPNTPHAVSLAKIAHQRNKEILVHVPMESISHEYPESGVITMEMTQNQVTTTFLHNIAAIPHAVGFNNHMGSLLTQHPGHMQWIMQTISKSELFFVDSYTTEQSVAQIIANENWVPNIRRDIFLDNERNEKAINHQFDQLLRIAKKKGIALAIGHPYPQTVAVLKRRISQIRQDGFQLVPASRLIELNMQRFNTWRAFLSP